MTPPPLDDTGDDVTPPLSVHALPELDEWDYELPADRIAQEPVARRDTARLLVLDRASGAVEHREFTDIVEALRSGDLLVVNDTRVIAARLRARKETGAAIELLLLESAGFAGDSWRVLWRPGKTFRSSARIRLAGDPSITVVPLGRDGDLFVVGFERDGQRLARDEVLALSDVIGETPLPPYIRRARGDGQRPADRERYQTVYARAPGAAAAPTAGLHFTDELLARLETAGIERVAVTLHVGVDTFRPLSREVLRSGELHGEHVIVTAEAGQRICAARREGRRVIAVGTTTARALESFAAAGAPLPYDARTRLFIRPPYEFRIVDGLVTNFHLPRSGLLMMVAAFAGRERLFDAYRDAIAGGYRFYSYGDAMVIVERW